MGLAIAGTQTAMVPEIMAALLDAAPGARLVDPLCRHHNPANRSRLARPIAANSNAIWSGCS